MVTKLQDSNFISWAFVKRDIDGLIIAYLLYEAISGFIRSIVKAVVQPVVDSMIPQSDMEENEQVLNVFGLTKIRFKLQYLIYGFIQMMLTVFIAYVLIMWVYKALKLEVNM